MEKYDSDIPEGHAMQEHRDLKPRDQRLRRHGFRIEQRPNRGPAVWSLAGKRYEEPEAHFVCDQKEQAG